MSVLAGLQSVFAAADEDPRPPKSGSDLARLQLTGVIEQKFRLYIKELHNGKIPLAEASSLVGGIDLTGLQPAVTRTLDVGEKIPLSNYVITSIKPKGRTDERGRRVDISEIGLRHVRTNAEIVYIVGRIADLPEFFAQFKDTQSDAHFNAGVGDTIEFPAGSGVTYQLRTIERENVTLRRLAPEELFRIDKAPQSK